MIHYFTSYMPNVPTLFDRNLSVYLDNQIGRLAAYARTYTHTNAYHLVFHSLLKADTTEIISNVILKFKK